MRETPKWFHDLKNSQYTKSYHLYNTEDIYTMLKLQTSWVDKTGRLFYQQSSCGDCIWTPRHGRGWAVSIPRFLLFWHQCCRDCVRHKFPIQTWLLNYRLVAAFPAITQLLNANWDEPDKPSMFPFSVAKDSFNRRAANCTEWQSQSEKYAKLSQKGYP